MKNLKQFIDFYYYEDNKLFLVHTTKTYRIIDGFTTHFNEGESIQFSNEVIDKKLKAVIVTNNSISIDKVIYHGDIGNSYLIQ